MTLAKALGGATLLMLGACTSIVPPSPQPAPSPAPAPSPSQQPPAPHSTDWRDVPATPGNWSWSMEGNLSVAQFAGGALELRCDRSHGTVTLARAGAGTGRIPMTVITTNLTRSMSGIARAGPPPMITATFSARDPLLDAMAFSRGRFAVEVAGLQTIYAPSWPEVSRVIEDCR